MESNINSVKLSSSTRTPSTGSTASGGAGGGLTSNKTTTGGAVVAGYGNALTNPVFDGIDDDHVIFTGYLLKRSNWLKEWRKRYVILKKRRICFLKSVTSDPHDEVMINEIISIRSASDKIGKQYSFEISTSDITYFLQAETEKEKDMWVGIIGKAIVQSSKAYVSFLLVMFFASYFTLFLFDLRYYI